MSTSNQENLPLSREQKMRILLSIGQIMNEDDGRPDRKTVHDEDSYLRALASIHNIKIE